MRTADALVMLVNTKMRPFEKTDYYGFSGVESEKPMIGQCEDEEFGPYTLVLDGSHLQIFNVDGEECFNGEMKDMSLQARMVEDI